MKYAILSQENKQALLLAIEKRKPPFSCELTKISDDRTSKQNAYLWSACYPKICEVSGYTKDDVHEWVCGRHFGWKDKTVPKTPKNLDGVESVPVRTTTRDADGKVSVMDKADFAVMLESVVYPLAESLGVIILDGYSDEA